jgi:tripeptide aminopeptidase
MKSDPLQLFNRKRALKTVLELMAIPGKSCEEGAVADYVKTHLIEAGVPADDIQHDSAHTRTRQRGQVGNLIWRFPSNASRAVRRMLAAHLDTVPICVGCQPKRQGNFVRSAVSTTGLGADNRAGTAVLLCAALELLEHDWPHPPLTFCWFVQEEIGLEGSRHVTKSLLGAPKLAFNWDGGSPQKMTIGATGGYRMEMEIHGLASHAGGAPERGVSAIAIAALAIADLQRSGWHGLVHRNGHRGTSNVGVIRGGDATNVVTDHVVLRAEARSHDPKFRARIVREIEGAFKKAAREIASAEGKRGKVEIEGRLDYESFLLEVDEPCVLVAEAAIRQVGLEPERAVSNGGVDANWTTRHGIPTVTLGCGQMNPHMVTEALDVEQFLNACRIGLVLATG